MVLKSSICASEQYCKVQAILPVKNKALIIKIATKNGFHRGSFRKNFKKSFSKCYFYFFIFCFFITRNFKVPVLLERNQNGVKFRQRNFRKTNLLLFYEHTQHLNAKLVKPKKKKEKETKSKNIKLVYHQVRH